MARSKGDYDGTKPLSDPKHELFSVLFTTNTLPHYWGHGQHCYTFAYGFTQKIEKVEDEIDELAKKLAVPRSKRKGKETDADIERKIKVKHNEIKKMERTCRSCAPRLLASADIKLRCGFLLDTLAINLIVDRELTYLIQQREDNAAKMDAIQHYDKKMQRIREKVDIKHEFEPITGFDYIKPVKVK